MKNLVTTSLYFNSSHDCRGLAKAALICRREIASYRNDNNHKFTVEEHGFREEDGIIRDRTVHRRGVVSPPGLRLGLFTVGATDNIDHNSSSTTSAESFSMALLYRCFKHILPWTMGRRETCLWFQSVTVKLLFLLNIPLSCR